MDSPSTIRSSTSRRSLHRKPPSLSRYQSKPITKHYEVNNQILKAFDTNYEQKHYDVAYALGMQFVETALLEIPKHGYFYSQRHERDRMQSALDAVRVTQTLQELETSVQIPPTARFRVERLALLALEQVEQASNDQACTALESAKTFEIHRAQTEAELKQQDQKESSWACEPLLALAESLSGLALNPCCDRQQPSQQSASALQPAPLKKRLSLIEDDYVPPKSVPPPKKPPSPSSRIRLLPESPTASIIRFNSDSPISSQIRLTPESPTVRFKSESPTGSQLLLNPESSSSNLRIRLNSLESPTANTTTIRLGSVREQKLEPPGLKRSKQSAASIESTESDLERALFLSGLEISFLDIPPPLLPESSVSMSLIELQRTKSQESSFGMGKSQILQFQTLCSLYHEDFGASIREGRIWISYINTYQGRMVASTNGCTIIAPLLCMHHLIETDGPLPYSGIPDDDIEQAIDKETPIILTELRQELGLLEHAFLIPSDAHHYLIQNGQLSDKQFLTVLGGNVLDDSHLQAFVDALRDIEHKYKKMAATFYFHEHVISILQVRRSSTVTWYDVIDSLPSKEFLKWPEESIQEFHIRYGLSLSEEEFFQTSLLRTARIRCTNADALTTCLRWYACSKFTHDNIKFIDQYAWDEKSCDFDPRVFQGFVWIDHPQ
ncbi:hypothetical protein FisN_14Lh142 [Fistulifera solaris]|uniref:Uncharacterized protein n=1 Tax=Fistulifera solaris TaxID=1519565 RepID=A0A1Z5J9H3_FISSO|nr:hypothetical protein FisN_14Lh142 [Fistulifera solaris]|eukprot:GAX10635.1 hypothetical protein FisN_14Lh142 [Fistulifera solaris]